MRMNEQDDVEPSGTAWAVSEFVREKFGPLVEIDYETANEFWVFSNGFAAEIRVGDPVEVIGHCPIDKVCEIPLCDPDSSDLIVEQIREWRAKAKRIDDE